MAINFDRSIKNQAMNTRMLLAGLAAGIVAFLLGWLLFGILLMGYFESNTLSYEGLMKSEEEFNYLGMLLANILTGILIAWLLWRMGVTSIGKGLSDGFTIGLLIYGSMALYYYSMMNWYTGIMPMVVEILANSLWTAVIGGVAATVLGAGRKASVASA